MKNTKSFKNNYVLIDYENVHPKTLSALTDEHYRVYLFTGPNQPYVGVSLAQSLHQLGPDRSRYIIVSKTGNNALDFHITYYLGLLTQKDPEAWFHIISKDKGYDPLIDHLKTQGIQAGRRDSIADIPIVKIGQALDFDEKFKAALEHLKSRGQSKPGQEKTLKNTLKATFKEKLSDPEIAKIFDRLLNKNYIKLDGKRISYSLPA